MDLKTRLLFLCVTVTHVTVAVASTIKATEDVQLTASPSSMHESFTRELTLNCSLDNLHNTSDLSSLMSLILSKANESSSTGFTEIASLASGSPDAAVVKQSLGAHVTGHLEAKGQSFISYQWQYPDSNILGEYRCEAFGMEATGHPRTSESDVEITEDRVGIENVISRMKEMEENYQIKIGELQKNMDHEKQTLQRQIDSQQAILHDHSTRFNEARKALIEDSVYSNGHEYLLSRQIWGNDYVADHYCRLFGGYLVEVQDDREFELVYNLMKKNNAKEHIFYGGREEHNGTWYYQNSGQRVSYFNWASGQPNDVSNGNCLGMQSSLIHGMNDLSCLMKTWSRFVCEVE